MDIVVAPDPQGAATEAAAWLARQIRNAVARRGVATVALSGGSTPAMMLAALAEMPVPWEATTVFQVDERVAPDGDPDRNASLLEPLRSCGASINLMPVTAADLESASRRYAAIVTRSARRRAPRRRRRWPHRIVAAGRSGDPRRRRRRDVG